MPGTGGAFPEISPSIFLVCTTSTLLALTAAGGDTSCSADPPGGLLCDRALLRAEFSDRSGLVGRLRVVTRLKDLGVMVWPPNADAMTVVPEVAVGTGSGLSVRNNG